jgi:hypothetical protein
MINKVSKAQVQVIRQRNRRSLLGCLAVSMSKR